MTLQNIRDSVTVAISLGVLLITLIATRVITGLQRRSKSTTHDGKLAEPPVLPYWIPFLGHVPSLVLRPEKLFEWIRDHTLQGVFAIKLLGCKLNIVWSPEMTQTVLSQTPDIFDIDAVLAYCVYTIGGLPRKYANTYEIMLKLVVNGCLEHIQHGPKMSRVMGKTLRNIAEIAPDLVTFTHSMVDQMPWERVSDAVPIVLDDGEHAVEVDLLPLVKNFIAHQAIPPVFGTDLLRNFPDLLRALWDFNSGFLLLATAIPRWFPIPKLQRGYRGRDYMLNAFNAMHHAMDATVDDRYPGSQWSNLDDVSTMMWDMHAYYRELGLPPDARSDMWLLWAANANSNILVFWLLLRIYSSPELLIEIREEIAPHVQVYVPPREFSISEPPRVTIEYKVLSDLCPLLKSCYTECLRLDSTSAVIGKVKQDFRIRNAAHIASNERRNPTHYFFKAGTFILIPHGDMYFTNSAISTNPTAFQPRRQISAENQKPESSTLDPFVKGTFVFPGPLYAEKEVLAAVAVFLALWDIEPVDNRGWRIPTHVMTAGVGIPSDNVRVRMRRRKGVWS